MKPALYGLFNVYYDDGMGKLTNFKAEETLPEIRAAILPPITHCLIAKRGNLTAIALLLKQAVVPGNRKL